MKVLKYIFCVPLAFLFAIIVSGTISVLQNLTNAFLCSVSLFLPPFTACNGDYTQRTDMAEVFFILSAIWIVKYLVPDKIKLFKTIIASILVLLYLCAFISSIILGGKVLTFLVLFVGCVIYLIVLIKKEPIV